MGRTRSGVRSGVVLAVMAVLVGAIVGVPAALTARPAAALTPAAYESEVLADSPVSWWPLDEPSGTSARDVTGPNQGYVQGGVTTGVEGPFGDGSSAFRFNGGACSGVDVGRDPASLALQTFTIENWFRTDTANRGIMFRWRGHGYGFYSNGGALLFGGYPNGSSTAVTAGEGLADGEWHHGVAQWTGSAFVLFVDGVKVGEQAASGTLAYGGGAAAIGRDADACDGVVPSFRGDMAQVAFYDHALPEDRVKAHYCAGVPTAPGCGPGLTSDAGPDQSVVEGSSVTLDGSASKGPDSVEGSGTATTGIGGRLFATGGPVEVEVRPASAGITSQLWLFEPEGSRHQIATNRDVGQTYQVGSFAAGDEFVFGIAYSNLQFRMGPGDRNPDLLEHANVVEVEPGVYDVGFEDINGGGDRDYNDNVFRFRGAVAAARPLTYRWDLVSAEGPPVQLSDPTSVSPSFVAFDDGRYTFRLTVSDGLATSTDEVTVTVTNQVPVVTRAQAGPTATDGLAQVTVALSDPGAFDTHTVRFDWGDGTPPEDVPAAVNGSGWGYAYAGHVYASTGDKTVTVTVIDDDGGTSAPATATFNVGAAGQGEPSPGAALWAAAQSAPLALDIKGWGNKVDGLVHSNNDVLVAGHHQQLTGGVEYRTAYSQIGYNQTVTPAPRKVAASGFPYSFNVADYKPGGRAAVAAGSKYRAVSSWECLLGTWIPKKPITPGLYYVPCAVTMPGWALSGQITIVATGPITVTGAFESFTPYSDGLLFMSTSNWLNAVDLNGAHQRFGGSIFAPNGTISISGSHNEIECGVMGQRVVLVGTGNHVGGTNCGTVGTGGGTPVAVAAPPLLVPNLAAKLTADKSGVLPGENVTYEASVSNGSPEAGGATLFLPVQLGADNRGASPVTITGASYRLEIHDPATNTWSTLATTDPTAPAAQRTATLTARPNPTTGVTYPTGPDTITGTQVSPGRLGSWAATAQITLSPDQLSLLLDPARVDAIRNTVDTTTNGPLIRKIARFSADPLAELRAAPKADISNVRLNVTRPGAVPETIDSTTVPALATLTPGQTASVTRTATASTPDVKATGESDESYLGRLDSLDGTGLFATTYATGNAGVGQLIASQQLAQATINVPVVSAKVSAPSAVNAGDPATWTVELTNTGSATATNLDLRVDVAGIGNLTLDGLPAELAPGASATVTATTPTTAGTTATLVGTATLRWSHPGAPAGMYGPVGGRAQVTARPPVALAVTKFASTGSSTPPGQLQYNLDIANSGTTPLTGVVLDDPIDDNAFIVDNTLTTSAGTIVTGASTADRAVRIDVGDLAVDAHVTVTFRVDYSAASPGTTRLTNQATATSNQLPPVLSDDPYLPGTADPTVTPISTGSGGGGGGGGTDPGPTLQGCTPGDTATVTAPTPIGCTLAPQPGTTVATWRLSVQPLGAPDSEQHVLGTGTGTNVTGTIDPTVLTNGLYTVRIVARGSDDAASRLETTLIVDGRLKLGRNRISYTDMAVPVGGIPLEVQRTYDTVDRLDTGDFGHGWTIGLSNFRVQTNRVLGAGGWEQYQCGVAVMVAVFCLRPTTPHAVTVTWPDGRTETFDLTPQKSPPSFSFLSPVAYTGRPGTTSKLEPAPGDQYAMYMGDGSLYVPLEANLYNPTRFTLVARNDVRYLLDTKTGLVEAADREGNVTTVTANGVTGPDGIGITFERNSDGRIEKIVGPSGETVTYATDPNGDLTEVTDAENHKATYTYQAGHYLTGASGAATPATTWHYDTEGRVDAISTPNGTTPIDPDVTARREVITSADGRLTTVVTYNDLGDVTRQDDTFDGRTITSTFTVDPQGRPLTITDPAGTTTIAYDPAGNATRIQDQTGVVTEATYTALSQVASVTVAGSLRVQNAYNGESRLISSTRQGAGTTTYTYDERGRLDSTTEPNGLTTSITYGRGGLITKFATPTGDVTYAYDPSGRMAARTDQNNATTRLGYDANGMVTSETDENGAVQKWHYTQYGEVDVATDKANRTTSFTYDTYGQLRTRTDRNGKTTSFDYSPTGQLIRQSSPTEQIVVGYDPLGRPSSITSNDAVLGFTWDNAGNLTSQTTAGTATHPGSTVALTATSDAAGRARSVSGLGSTTSYRYDTAGRLDQVADTIAGAIGIGYDPADRLASISRPNGVNDAYAYDSGSRLTAKITTRGGTELTRAAYTYNAAGQRDTYTDADGAHVYGYDLAGRLTSATHPTASGISNESYTYDPAGNRKSSHRDPVGSITYDQAERLQGDATYTYTYDNEGNRTGRRHRTTGQVTTYDWNTEGQLTRVAVTGGTTSTYRYDGLGRRIEATEAGATTRFIYDGVNLRHTLDASGNRTATFITAPGAYDDILATVDASNRASYPLTDALGTSTAQIDTAGAPSGQRRYDSFGVATTPTSSTRPFGWTGLVEDPTGLVHARARNLDPATGSFLSEDPLAGQSAYQYVSNAPTVQTDPSGKTAFIEYDETNEPAEKSSPSLSNGQIKCPGLNYPISAGGLGPQLRGLIVETAVGEMLGSAFTHHGGQYPGQSGTNRIPDFASGNDLVEVKYTKSLSKTKQITDYAQRVQDIEGTLTIYTKDTTKLSRPLQDLVAESGGRIEVVKCL